MARTQQTSRLRDRVRRPRGGSLLRACLLGAICTVMVPAVVASTSGRAFADGELALAAEAAWISEYAGSAMTVAESTEVSSYAAAQAATATSGTGAVAGVTPQVATSSGTSALGMIVNSVGVLGGLAFLWHGGSDAPTLPAPQPADTYTGSSSFGWSNMPNSTPQAAAGGQAHMQFLFPSTSRQCQQRISPTIGSVETGNSQNAGTTGSTVGTQVSGSAATIKIWFQASGSSCVTMPSSGAVYTWIIPATGGSAGANPSVVGTTPATVPRYIESQITCKTAAGSSTVYSREDGPFSFDPAQPYTMPEVPDMVCPAGTWLDSGTRKLHTQGLSPSTDVPLQQPYAAPDWIPAQVTAYPDCYPATTTVCHLELVKVSLTPDLECHSIVAGGQNPCADWWSDPNRGTKYECHFGTHVVALRRCKPYEEAFSTGVVTSTPTDPDTDTTEGEAIPEADPTPEQTPDLGDCVPGWSELLTPWWVFKAQACALAWAFVPDTSTWGVAELKAQMEARPPFSVAIGLSGTVTGIGSAFLGAGSCGLLADFTSTGRGAITAPITCQAVKDSIAGFSVLYTIMQAAMWTGWGIYVWRYLSGMFERGN